MDTKRFFRYLAPNLVTFASLLFGMSSIVSSFEGRYADAAWYVLFSVLTDKLDGFVARLVKGTSEFGVQLDSFADFLNFGIAPATLWYCYLSRPELLATGVERALTVSALALWVLAVTFRLARYNIVGDDPRCKRIFFGVPTTLMGGMLGALFLTVLKYGADPSGLPIVATDEPRLLSTLHVGAAIWRYWPILVAVGAFLMASGVKIPKLGVAKSKIITVFIFANVFFGYAAGASRHFPEYLCFGATLWILVSIVWGQFNHDARLLHPPPIFPREDHPPHKMPQRPEEDLVPDEDDATAPFAGTGAAHHKI